MDLIILEEIGPGKVLKGLIGRIDKGVSVTKPEFINIK